MSRVPITRPEIDRRDVRARTQRLRAMAVAALLAGVGVQLPTGQGRPTDQVPTFRVRTDVVQLDVSVLDEQGSPARGLSAADFTVLEGSAPQPVVAFAAIEVPTWSVGTAAWMRDVGSDVASNRLDARRAVVIVLDDFSSRWDPGVTRVVKSIAGAAIDQLGPADLAAVVYVLNRAHGQEFTLDRTRLRAAVERFTPSGLPPASDNRFSASTPTDGLRAPSRIPGPSGACLHDCVGTALRNVGEILGSWPGARKTVVLISPGRRGSGIPENLSDADDRGRMFAALQEANVNVYQFDPHGLQAGPQPFTDFGTFAENTGGRGITNTNAPADFIPQMFRENSSYYLLGFRADGARDGRFHRIKVQVNRPGLHVRAPAGYYASPDRRPVPSKPPASAVDRALSGGLPAGDLPVSLTVAPFAIAGKPGAAVAVVARVDLAAGVAPGSVVEFVAVAFNDQWKQVAAITQRLMLPPATESVLFSETAARLNLPPGRYEVRAAMRNTADDRTGSVYASVTVPDFARDPISLSGIAIEQPSGGAAMLEDLASVVPARMTTSRVFLAGERVAVVARVYQGRARTLIPVRVTARIVDGQDRTASTTETTLEPTAFGAERHADYRLDLPLDRLAAGEYLLTLDASTATTSVRRDLRFTARR